MKAGKSNYCPLCFNDTLTIKEQGKVDIYINSKHRDTGRFLFNLDNQDSDDLQEILREKLKDFFKWYGSFNNKEIITKIDIVSTDFICESGCIIPSDFKPSIIDVLVPQEEYNEMVRSLAKQFEIKLEI